jgi:hypothetical protein
MGRPATHRLFNLVALADVAAHRIGGLYGTDPASLEQAATFAKVTVTDDVLGRRAVAIEDVDRLVEAHVELRARERAEAQREAAAEAARQAEVAERKRALKKELEQLGGRATI